VDSVFGGGNQWREIPQGYILNGNNYLVEIKAVANNSPPAVLKVSLDRSDGHWTMKNASGIH
jgi:hypothetical protein